MDSSLVVSMHPWVEVRPSPIHGQGLFARTLIPDGTLIGRYEGPRVECEEDDGDYVLWITPDHGPPFGIDGRNEFRYVNHASEANAIFYDDLLYALRDILPGEEITHHYGEEWELGWDEELEPGPLDDAA